jgi:uncharacterized protein
MTPLIIASASLLIFLAAIVRGFSGFGFSLLAVTSLSLLLPAQEVVPSIFMLEVAASLHLLPGIWKDVHWKSLVPLIVGCLVATPLGVYLLAHAPQAPMQIALGVFVLVAVLMMALGYAMKTMPNMITSTLVGAASGFCNGAFGIGGPPVILFYFASPAGHIAGRASVIAFFLATDLIGLTFQAGEGLVTKAAFMRALIFLPALLIGVWIGSRGFKSANQETFRKIVLGIMALLGAITLIKGVSGVI